MKLDFILVSAILVVLVFLPFVLLPLLRNSDLKKLTKKFSEEEKNHHLNTQLKDNWNHNYIGLDLAKKKLLFVQSAEVDFVVEVIDLNLINSCKPFIEEINSQKKGKSGSLLRRVNLEFIFKTGITKSINLFDYDLQVTQDMETIHAMKWADLINQQLGSPAVLKRTA